MVSTTQPRSDVGMKPGDTFDVRTSRAAQRVAWRNQWPLHLVTIALVAILVYRYSTMWVLLLVVIPLWAVAQWRIATGMHVKVTPAAVFYGGLGPTKRVLRDDVATVTLLPEAKAGPGAPTTFLSLQDAGGRQLLQLSSVLWAPHDLRRVAAELGRSADLRVAEPGQPASTLARTYPGSLRLAALHPWVHAVVFALVYTGVAIGIVLALP